MQVHWRHPHELKEVDRDFAMGRLGHLEAGHRDLTDLWIDVARSSGHHRKGDSTVTIRCQARRATIVASGHDAEPGLALRAAVEKFEREVLRLRDRRSVRRVKTISSSPPVLGIIDRIMREEEYGFILTDAGEQIYFHRNALNDALPFEDLREGQRVALNFHAGNDGPQASIVTTPPPDAALGP